MNLYLSAQTGGCWRWLSALSSRWPPINLQLARVPGFSYAGETDVAEACILHFSYSLRSALDIRLQTRQFWSAGYVSGPDQ